MSSPDLVILSLTAAAAPIVDEAVKGAKSPLEATVVTGSVRDDLSTVEVTDGALALSRAAVTDAAPGGPLEVEANRIITQTAVALDPDAVFGDARKRIERVFRLNMVLLVTLAIILLIGIGGAIVSALFLEQNTWPFIFGGVTAADLIGVYIFKPIKAINRALIGTQQLDLLYLRLREGLMGCDELNDVGEKLACRDAVWDKVWEDLTALNAIA